MSRQFEFELLQTRSFTARVEAEGADSAEAFYAAVERADEADLWRVDEVQSVTAIAASSEGQDLDLEELPGIGSHSPGGPELLDDYEKVARQLRHYRDTRAQGDWDWADIQEDLEGFEDIISDIKEMCDAHIEAEEREYFMPDNGSDGPTPP